MKNKPLENKEYHHWWPKCVSKHWKDDQGVIRRLSFDGTLCEYKKLEKIGYTTDAHSIKFSEKPTYFDERFEHCFDFADGNEGFVYIISLLKDLQRNIKPLEEEDKVLDILLECLLSLVVRSPSFCNSMGKDIEEITKNAATELPVKLMQREAMDRFKMYLCNKGKFAILFSREQEFIFGDGFYNNFKNASGADKEIRMIVPVLPNICVYYIRPINCGRNPRWVAIDLGKDDIDFINKTTMAYSRDYVFYKSQKPIITEEFSCRKFLPYPDDKDPVADVF